MALTKPILLDETGQKINETLKDVANAIRGYEPEKKEWSVVINTAQSSPILSQMGGDHTSWMIYRNKIGRYLLHNDGKAYKLDKKDSRLFEDGTLVDETQGHVMVRLPRLYYKVTTDGTIATITMCEREFAENCEELDEQWIGAYLGSVVGNVFVSRSGLNPTRGRNISQFHSLAQANSEDGKWGLTDYNQRQKLVLLYLCEYLDLNSQAALGNGMTGTGKNWCAVVQNAKTGMTAELGDECGKVLFTEDGQLVGGACHVSLFGVEDPYGWFWEMVQGCYFGNSENEEQEGTECFLYEGNRMPTTEELATKPTGLYRQLVRPITSGWVKALLMGEKFDVIPATLGGGSTTYWCDYHYANNTGQLLLFGGIANYGANDGLVCSTSNVAFSYASSYIGSRLAYYGQVDIMHHETNTIDNQ